jgi:hypothetical protein
MGLISLIVMNSVVKDGLHAMDGGLLFNQSMGQPSKPFLVF